MFITIVLAILQMLVGMLYGNLLEWLMHKYVLHGLGRNKASFFSFHWHVHHRVVRIKKFEDAEYFIPFWSAVKTRGAEVVGLVVLALLHVWVLFFNPWIFIGSTIWIFVYYFVHKKSHTDVEWARKWVPWHYDHHMGLEQNKNWCVTIPLWDYILGTRKKYDYDKRGHAKKT